MADSSPQSAAQEEAPKSWLDKLGAGLPIALTMLATTFAGMSTSELQQAMFWRSYAAQDQSKATNQWSLMGFKRSRALDCENTAKMLRIQAKFSSFVPKAKISPTDPDMAAAEKLAINWLDKGPPKVEFPDPTEETIKSLMDAIQQRKPETELLAIASKVKQDAINNAIDKSEAWSEALDSEWKKTLDLAMKIVDDEIQATAESDPGRAAAAQSAALQLDNRRYRAESFVNQKIGYLYDARVKVSTAVSDKHREKSKNFFYAMLAAQVGATLSSLSLARKQKSALWLIAGLAGLVSIIVGAIVFLM